MKKHKEILSTFGQKFITECFDGTINHLNSLREKKDPPAIFKERSDFLKSLSDEQFVVLKKLTRGNFEAAFFKFFNIFEENQQYKISCTENEVEYDLVKISEMLKAEHLVDDGWINRFSEFGEETK